jgi:hypothetical protein
MNTFYQAWMPDGILSNQNPNLGKFWRVLQRKMLVYFKAIRYIFPRFGMLHQEKSGNHA